MIGQHDHSFLKTNVVSLEHGPCMAWDWIIYPPNESRVKKANRQTAGLESSRPTRRDSGSGLVASSGCDNIPRIVRSYSVTHLLSIYKHQFEETKYFSGVYMHVTAYKILHLYFAFVSHAVTLSGCGVSALANLMSPFIPGATPELG